MQQTQNKELNIITKAPHYNTGKFEPIDIMLECKMGGCIFTVVKYLSRAGKKGGQEKYLEDLKKARYYLEKEIAQQSPEHEEHDKTMGLKSTTVQALCIDWKLSAGASFAMIFIFNGLGVEYGKNHTEKITHYTNALDSLNLEIQMTEKEQTPIPRTMHGMANPN